MSSAIFALTKRGKCFRRRERKRERTLLGKELPAIFPRGGGRQRLTEGRGSEKKKVVADRQGEEKTFPSKREKESASKEGGGKMLYEEFGEHGFLTDPGKRKDWDDSNSYRTGGREGGEERKGHPLNVWEAGVYPFLRDRGSCEKKEKKKLSSHKGGPFLLFIRKGKGSFKPTRGGGGGRRMLFNFFQGKEGGGAFLPT